MPQKHSAEKCRRKENWSLRLLQKRKPFLVNSPKQLLEEPNKRKISHFWKDVKTNDNAIKHNLWKLTWGLITLAFILVNCFTRHFRSLFLGQFFNLRISKYHKQKEALKVKYAINKWASWGTLYESFFILIWNTQLIINTCIGMKFSFTLNEEDYTTEATIIPKGSRKIIRKSE